MSVAEVDYPGKGGTELGLADNKPTGGRAHPEQTESGLPDRLRTLSLQQIQILPGVRDVEDGQAAAGFQDTPHLANSLLAVSGILQLMKGRAGQHDIV